MRLSKIDKEIKKLIKEKKFHSLPASYSPKQQMNIRRLALEYLTKTKLKAVSNPVFDINKVSKLNCENLIGKVEIPLGIVGPLKIKGGITDTDIYVPLSTTEGALIASVNRGCKAISVSGGAYVFIEKSGMTRSPLFRTENLEQSKIFVIWIKSHFKNISKMIEKAYSHISLLSITPYIAGRNVYLRFVFDTGDAMGMNMVTFACEYIVREYIEKKIKIPCVSISGNVCADKKASWLNIIEKRGHSVHAEVFMTEKVVRDVLKADMKTIFEIYIRKNLIGSAIAGSMGFNAHYANIIAALFAATGQDLAHVVEGSSGITTVEIVNNNLYFSVSLPDLPLGTVGGGTNLTTQKEALSIMGISGGGKPPGNNAKKLAEITAATVLAGEISLLAALANKDLAKAHKRFGRGEKI